MSALQECIAKHPNHLIAAAFSPSSQFRSEHYTYAYCSLCRGDGFFCLAKELPKDVPRHDLINWNSKGAQQHCFREHPKEICLAPRPCTLHFLGANQRQERDHYYMYCDRCKSGFFCAIEQMPANIRERSLEDCLRSPAHRANIVMYYDDGDGSTELDCLLCLTWRGFNGDDALNAAVAECTGGGSLRSGVGPRPNRVTFTADDK